MLWLFAACAPSVPPLPADAPTSGQRLYLPSVEMDAWTDYLSIEAAVDDECAFLEPLVRDDSTVWPPLQVFWVIYDNEKDVKEGDELHDTYFIGDQVLASDYAWRASKPPLGFLFIPPLYRGFLNIEETLRPSPHRLEVYLGAPIHSWLLADARLAEDGGGCELETHRCADPCEIEQPLHSVYLELGLFNSVQNVEFRAEE